MEADEQAKLVLAFAKVLYVNGQATEQTVSAAERLARARGLHAALVPHWSELQLVANDRHGTLIAQAAAYPAGVEMNRVASTMRAIEDVVSGRLGPDVAVKAIDDIARSSPAPTWLFVLAAAAGAVALAVIFGVKHFSAAILIFVSAGAGAILRRALGQLSTNFFLQPFGVAIFAGIIGAMAVRCDHRDHDQPGIHQAGGAKRYSAVDKIERTVEKMWARHQDHARTDRDKTQ